MTLRELLIIAIFLHFVLFITIAYIMFKIQISEERKKYQERSEKERRKYDRQNFIGKIENFKY